jgi:Ca-activated chloride channel homolog
MANLSRGAVAYPDTYNGAAALMQEFLAQVRNPALRDVTIDWGQMRVSEVFPRQIPDLYRGHPVILTGRFEGAGHATVRVRGTIGGKTVEFLIPADLSKPTAAHPALPNVWARLKLTDLMDEYASAPTPELGERVKQLALDYGLVSPFTAFVAVDATRPTKDGELRTVPATGPIPVPQDEMPRR